MCCKYWPDPGMTLTYGACTVENVSEDIPRQEYIKRSFRVALANNVSCETRELIVQLTCLITIIARVLSS